MRPANQLVHSRARVRPRYALFPLEGFPFSRLSAWPNAQVRVLASPALGAAFVEMLIDLPAGESGRFESDAEIETFYFVMSGAVNIRESAASKSATVGSFGLIPPGTDIQFTATDTARLLILRKRYQPARGIELFKSIHGNESRIKAEIWGENPHTLLQTLIPDEFSFDMAMNIFTFDPGFGLPIVETHVMEHGLYFMQGKGMYFLDGEWMEVEKDDFIWMGPYCPQSFYATGPTPSRYIYYKNVNRDILV
ncbi:MAG: (S)-ureidoglycine aminohydrolase [Tepidisphaeraceae bacterium]|jgi:(S)-ureidoglycine aminohydrolase